MTSVGSESDGRRSKGGIKPVKDITAFLLGCQTRRRTVKSKRIYITDHRSLFNES